MRDYQPSLASGTADADLILYRRNSSWTTNPKDGLALFSLTFEQQKNYSLTLLGWRLREGGVVELNSGYTRGPVLLVNRDISISARIRAFSSRTTIPSKDHFYNRNRF